MAHKNDIISRKMWMDDDSDSDSTNVLQRFENLLQRVKENDPSVTEIDSIYWYREYIQNMTDDDWGQLGHDLNNNTHLQELSLIEGVLNDQKMMSLFGGMTGSKSIERIELRHNEFGVEGVRSMMPLLQNASNLKVLDVTQNNIGSEGFNLLLRALSSSPIETLNSWDCGIESIEIDDEHIPKKLTALSLANNNIDIAGCRQLARLLHSVNSTLTFFSINESNIQSEGINLLWSALCDGPIKTLSCSGCGVESIEIDDDHIPKELQVLNLSDNMFSVEGCRGLTKLLRGEDSKLRTLKLENSSIDDGGVAILVNALQDNESLKYLYLNRNESISNRGKAMLLKLVNDITSIKATLKSNHTLQILTVDKSTEEGGADDDSTSTRSSSSEETNDCLFQRYIKAAILTNAVNRQERVGREKVIKTQLDSVIRSDLCRLLGVDRSLYSEIDPLHLPEVLSLVGQCHGQKELFVALKSSVADLISTVNRKQCIQQQMAYHAAKLQELGADLAAIEEADRNVVEIGSSKRRRI